MFAGYKTYIVAGITVISTIGTYLVGDMTLGDAIQLVVTAVIGVTLRAGIKEDAKASTASTAKTVDAATK